MVPRDAPLWQVLACGAAAGLLLGAGLPAKAEPRALPPPPALERGRVYVRLQAPGSLEPVHRNLPADARVEAGVMLDNPARIPRPLLLERIRVGEEPLLVLERQLSADSRTVRGGTLNRQRIQVLDAHPLPREEVEIVAGVAGMAACNRNSRPDRDVVAIRQQRAGDDTPPLLQAWVVDRSRLRLQPVPVAEVSCPPAIPEEP